jgi:hypothetical protein
MRSGAGAGASAALLGCIALVVPYPTAARSDETLPRQVTPMPVIGPGQEERIAAMLGKGAALPAGCKFVTGQIDRAVVRGVYGCRGGEVALEFRHPSEAPPDVAHTKKIAIVPLRGTPPAALVAALQARIRKREGGFNWIWPKPVERTASGTGASESGPSGPTPSGPTVPSEPATPSAPAARETAPEDVAPTEAAAKLTAPRATAFCGPPPGPPGNLSSYVPDCYPRFAAVLVGFAQTMVMVLGLALGLIRLHRTPDGR